MFAFNVRERGSSHIAGDKPCQDYAISHYTNEYAIGVVADGHGSSQYLRSERGSMFAATITMQALKELMDDSACLRRPMLNNWQQQIASSILTRWQMAIAKDIEQSPFTEDELSLLSDDYRNLIKQDKWQFAYGTTLIAVVKTRKRFFGLHIGDGKCVAVHKRGNKIQCSQPIPWDDDCFLNQTTSLCASDALTRFRYVYQEENIPDIVFVASDGVDDSYPSNERLYDFYTELGTMLWNNQTKAVAQLQSFLPQMSFLGSHDDISIAGVM